MAAALSSLTPFVQTYGSLFLPSAADLVTTSLFKRAIGDGKAEFAGLAAGMGALFFSGRQTSLVIGLTGAVLYLIYKVNTLINTAVQISKQDFHASLQDLDNHLLKIEKSFTYVSYKALDAQDPEFDTKFAALINEIAFETDVLRTMWEDQEFLASIHSIMESCKTILFSIRDILKLEMTDPDAQLQQMAVLLQDPNHVTGKKAFDRAFSFFNKIYRMVRCKGYVVTLPNVRNSPKGCDFYVSHANITHEYASRFYELGPQRELKKLFNTTQSELAGLLQHLYPGSPLTAKDEDLFPGDYDNNPYNLFRIT